MGFRRSFSFPGRVLPLLACVACALSSWSLACGGSSGVDDGDDDGSTSKKNDAGSTPSGSDDGPGGFGDDDRDAASTTKDQECTKMDIVFVVDNSGSMGQEQDNLAQNFPKFGSIIDGYKTKGGSPLDYRLAVATTDATKDRGAFVRKPTTASVQVPPWWPFPVEDPSGGCEAGPDRAWLERGDGKPVDYFACRARVGTGGSATEEPLRSLHLGLTDRIKDGANAANGSGFLRDDALLAFVVLTDEDESGAEVSGGSFDIGTYPAMFDAVKGGQRGRWAAAVIAGEKECNSSQFGDALEAVELKKFISDVGKNGVFSSICEGDLTKGLTTALATFDQACKSFPSGPN